MAKILLIDDSRLSRSMAQEAFTSTGHDIAEADDGQNGLIAYADYQPDCIVLDLLMPNMDGPEFLRQLRASGSTTPVIVVSADIQDTSRALCEELGANGFLNKPIKADVLVACVDAAITLHLEATP